MIIHFIIYHSSFALLFKTDKKNRQPKIGATYFQLSGQLFLKFITSVKGLCKEND